MTWRTHLYDKQQCHVLLLHLKNFCIAPLIKALIWWAHTLFEPRKHIWLKKKSIMNFYQITYFRYKNNLNFWIKNHILFLTFISGLNRKVWCLPPYWLISIEKTYFWGRYANTRIAVHFPYWTLVVVCASLTFKL